MPFAPPIHSEADYLEWVSHSLIPSGGVTVALTGGTIVGVLAVRRADDADWIDQLYVQPEHCNQGVGTQLLTAVLPKLRRPVRLYTFQQNEHSRAFYERFGFRAVEFGDGSQNEEGCPDVLYELVEGGNAA